MADRTPHTPGPWRVDRRPVTVAVRDSAGNYITENVRAVPNQEANARLIAAAPDLLAACKAAQRALIVGDVDALPLIDAAVVNAENR